MNKLPKSILLTLFLAFSAVAGNASDLRKAASHDPDITRMVEMPDYQIMAEATHALAMDPATNARNIQIAVKAGVVTLSGEVGSYTQKMLAARIVEEIPGIRDIRNELSFKYQLRRTDQEIARDVKGRLRHNASIHAGLISISVKNGMVDLVGIVPSEKERQHAEAEAWVVEGVRMVNSADLQVERSSLNQVEAIPSVFWGLTAKETVKEKIADDPLLARFPIHVDADGGIVWLTGIVGNFKAKQTAEKEASQVPGLKRVYNDITVRPSANRSDREIAADIMKALICNPDVDQRGIEVRVVKNEAFLSGTVNSIFMKERVENTVAQVRGVFQIQNALTTIGPVAVRPDDEIRSDINRQLEWNPFVGNDDVRLNVSFGIATLRGVVKDKDALLAAENSAQRGGALAIRDRLVVR
jgi:osmotically-inducible protein OsmY